MKTTTKSIMGGRVEIIGPAAFVDAAARHIEDKIAGGVLDRQQDDDDLKEMRAAKRNQVKPAKPAKPEKIWRGKSSLLTTQAAFDRLMKLDGALVGTMDYMGIAYFWAYEFRHYMRDATLHQRCAVHDALMAGGLELSGKTDRHLEIVLKYSGTKERNRKHKAALAAAKGGAK